MAISILAGGQSRRFGTDKALVRLTPDRPTLIERTVSVARELSDQVNIIGHDRFAELNLGVPIIADDEPGHGPLAAIVTALRVLDRPRVLVLACDMPCLSPTLLRMMIERPTTQSILIPYTDDGHYHPLHAIYARTTLASAQHALRRGNGSIRSFIDLVHIEAVPEADLRLFDPRLDSLFNLNEPTDMGRALRCA